MIVLATTSVSLLSPGSSDTEAEDWGGAPDPETGYSVVATGIRAHLSAPSGTAAAMAEGSSSRVQYRLLADPCPLEPDMRVKDEMTGRVYEVQWALPKVDLFGVLHHVVAGVTHSTATA